MERQSEAASKGAEATGTGTTTSMNAAEKRRGLRIPSLDEIHGAAPTNRPPTTLDFFSSRRTSGSTSSSSSSSASTSPTVSSSLFTSSLVPSSSSSSSNEPIVRSAHFSTSLTTKVVGSSSTTTTSSTTAVVSGASATTTSTTTTTTVSSSSSSGTNKGRSAFSASSLLQKDPYALSSPTMLNALLAAHSTTAATSSSTSTASTSARPSVVPRSPAPSASFAPPTASGPSSASSSRSGGRPLPLLVSTRQRGNKLLGLLQHVRWEYSETVKADYVMGAQACALYLSIKYHMLHPEYIHTRMRQVAGKFNLCVLLCLVDVEGSTQPLEELMLLCISTGFTLICAWSLAEAARYLETYKAYENKGAKIIKEKVDADPYAVLSDCLTSVRGVNKTDVLTLSSNFGSLKNIMDASMEELSLCPGLGARKVKGLYETFHAPLDPTKKKRKQTEAQIESFLNRKVRSKRKPDNDSAASASSASEPQNDEEGSVGEERPAMDVVKVDKGKEKADDTFDEELDS